MLFFAGNFYSSREVSFASRWKTWDALEYDKDSTKIKNVTAFSMDS